MRKGRNIALFLIAALLIVSCRPQADLSRDFPEVETWGETFDIFWKKMSTSDADAYDKITAIPLSFAFMSSTNNSESEEITRNGMNE